MGPSTSYCKKVLEYCVKFIQETQQDYTAHQVVGLMISEKMIKKNYNEPIRANDPHGVASLDPLGMVVRVL